MASQADTGRSISTQNTDFVMERSGRSRSLISQITTVLLQPTYFSKTFPTNSQWVWMAFLILLVVGFSAVRQSQLESAGTDSAGVEGGVSVDPGMGGFDPGMSIDPGLGGGIPLPPDTGGAAAADDISQPTMTALLAAGSIVLAWIGQAVVLSQVSLFNGKAPRLGRNFQIAVWAAVPIGVMAALQLLYYAAGGKGGAMGLTLVLDDWTWYHAQTDFVQAVIYSLVSRTTLFWLWSLVLLYLGARHTLRGYVIPSLFAVVAWIVIAVLAPVLTGAIEAPKPEAETTAITEPTMEGSEMMTDGLTPAEGGSQDSSAPAENNAPSETGRGG